MYNFEDEAKKEIEALPDDINNNKNEFKSWLIDRYGKTGTPSSYINSIGILNEKLDKDIFNILDLVYLFN